MKIAVVGIRGVPATFGGIEKQCEEIYPKIVKMGHKVTIYARKGYTDPKIKEYQGIKIIPLWTFKSKHLEAIFHTFWALIHIIFSDAEIIHFHAQGPCLMAWIPRIFAPQKKLVFSCHGLDWQRNKWNPIAKNIIYLGEVFSSKFFDTHITVSKALKEYYKNEYGINAITITNGTNINSHKKPEIIKKQFGLNGKDYMLFVGRLVPEKAPHKLIQAFRQTKSNKKLIIVGGSASTDDYESYLKEIAGDDPRIIFTSYLYDDALSEIYSNAYLYISTSELEGLPLTVLEAMSYAIPVLLSPIEPHTEIIGTNQDYGYSFNDETIESITEKLKYILSLHEEEVIQKGLKGQLRIIAQHNWNNSAKKHEISYKLTLSQTRQNLFSSLFKRSVNT